MPTIVPALPSSSLPGMVVAMLLAMMPGMLGD